MANFLLFSGYCLIASFSADNFVETLSAKIMNQKLKEEKAEAEEQKVVAEEMAERLKQETKMVLNSIPLERLKPTKEDGFLTENFVEDEGNDPQKGRWGASYRSNDREVTARVVRSSLLPELFNIHLEVFSTNQRNPLKGQVVFHLHPTFFNPERTVKVQNGRAELDLVAYGSFTVGVECDNRRTTLELDLAELEGVPQDFKER